MKMCYALEKNDVDKLIAGIGETYREHPMFVARLTTSADGKTGFLCEIEEMASLTFLQDEQGLFQLDKLEGDDGKIVISVLFNLWVKKHTGKDWPTPVP